MAKIPAIYHIICEGSSEEAYLKEFNRYLREKGLNTYLKSYNLRGVTCYKDIVKKYRDACKENKYTQDHIFIWLDNDVFQRGKFSKEILQKKLKRFSGIKYNYHNFEDFLVMHLPDEIICLWNRICQENNHFNNPLKGEEVEELIKEIFPGYKKGHLPNSMQFTDEFFTKLVQNQKSDKTTFKSDFIAVIAQIRLPWTQSQE